MNINKFIIYNPKTELFNFFIESLYIEFKKKNINICGYNQTLIETDKNDIILIIINPHFIYDYIEIIMIRHKLADDAFSERAVEVIKEEMNKAEELERHQKKEALKGKEDALKPEEQPSDEIMPSDEAKDQTTDEATPTEDSKEE